MSRSISVERLRHVLRSWQMWRACSRCVNAGGVDRVGLGALQRAVMKAPGLERVEQDDVVPGG